jgi:hypothetical protein
MISLNTIEGNPGLLTRAQALVAKESEVKNRKKYEALLRANGLPPAGQIKGLLQ